MRVIVADDEEIIRNALAHMIDYSSIGYELVGIAQNGMEAYGMICDEYPDVVITDIRMPILDGLGLIERAVKLDPNLRFVILSGYYEFEYARQAMKFGVRDYLLKPTDRDQLMEVLVRCRKEKEEARQRKLSEQRKMLGDLRTTVEESYLYEGLQCREFHAVYQKYRERLKFRGEILHACICNYVEERFLAEAHKDIRRILNKYGIEMEFPAVYVKNTVVLVLNIPSVTLCKQLAGNLESLRYRGQLVSFTVEFVQDAEEALWNMIFGRISRFNRILLLDEAGESSVISNDLTSPWKLERLREEILYLEPKRIQEILEGMFSQFSTDTEAAKNFTMGLYLKLNSDDSEEAMEIACDFFRSLRACRKVGEVREMCFRMAVGSMRPEEKRSVVDMIKSYVNSHISDENLSLKWLAENYLFMNVQYLSQLFIKKEGERFSDYLNRMRMEKARRLILTYRSDNIKDIASQVGFESNPRYFGQVFKRYYGILPSELIVQPHNREVTGK